MSKYKSRETLINIDTKEVIEIICIFSDIDNYEYFSYTCENVESKVRNKYTECQLKHKFRSLIDLDLEIHQKQYDRNVLENELCELNLLKENMRDTLKIVNKKLGDTKR